MKIALLVLDEVFDTGLSVLRDTFEVANDLARSNGLSGVHYEVLETGVRRRVRSHQGRLIPVEAASSIRRKQDFVIIPGLSTRSGGELERALERPDVGDAVALVKAWHGSGTTCAAACSSTFILGDAGVLNGLLATTTWWLSPLFRLRFPDVELDETRMVVESGRILTAGAAMAHLDAALFLIGKSSPGLARSVAEHLAVDSHLFQAPYIVPSFLAQADPMVQRFEQWVRKRIRTPFSMAEAAKATGASERTLERRVRKVLGRSPISFVQDLRLERATYLLKTTDQSLDEVAAAVGYENATTLGQLIRRKLGQSARRFRAAGRDSSV